MRKYIVTMLLILLVSGCSTPTQQLRDIKAIKQKAEMGDVAAQAEIGYTYQYGDGVTKDANEAFKWNLKAANLGSAMAQHNLAVMYDEGMDIREDNAEAIKWYRKAAEQGHPRSQLNLGVMYWKGEGVTKDMEQAWGFLNNVRISSTDNQAKWAARSALDEIKNEIGSKAGPFSYPEWSVLQESIK